jgi:hypothetical protein
VKKHRVNLTLPEDLWQELRKRVPPRQISQYVSAATAARLAEEDRASLRARLEEQYRTHAERDLLISEAFFASEEEVDVRGDSHGGGAAD